MLAKPIACLWALLLFLSAARAQFQFFEQMFGGQQQEHHQPEQHDVPSDSSWYQRTWDGDTCVLEPSLASISHIIARARIRILKTKQSWEMAAPSVFPKAGLRPGKL
ncbi:hypothetical protein Egran_03167 [Elaphomyces granulatus]|uniref:Uncharacterized protein n=1 Tax=Elaphomyces granulatus TaxID=519963 RepID=A0A232LY33_9EURO|nr:hypothetical protein Egran_03167 [Elaphomyces granulatus]